MAPPDEEKDKNRQCETDHSKVILNASVLKAGHQPGAEPNASAAFIESAIDDVFVNRPVQR
jgi:hypothetical protein